MLGSLPWSLVMLLYATIVNISEAKEIQGDIQCGTLMCTTAFVNSSNTITFQMTSLNQLGWMAIGFGTMMADSAMVIMWPNSDGSMTLSQRTAPGLVEPTPDPSPKRVATKYQPLSNLSAVHQTLSFTIPSDGNTEVNIIWAFGTVNPNSSDPGTTLLQHLDSGQFTLDLSKELDDDDSNSPTASQTVFDPSQTGSPTPSNGTGSEDTQTGVPQLETFEKLIIGHAVMTVVGFLIVLPFGAIAARWGRTFTSKWFKYHWRTQVAVSIPIVMIGWTLGPLAIADQGGIHADDAHKLCGILILPVYLLQLCLGSFIHFRKPPYPVRHPPQNFVHAGLGMTIIVLGFYQVKTGLDTDWALATERPINLVIFNNLWIAWAIFIPVVYIAGLFLIPRQLKCERELPPPYSPPSIESGIAVSRLLELGPMDDGTHDVYSDPNSTGRSRSRSSRTQSDSSNDIEMREVQLEERWTPVSLSRALSAPR